MKKIIKLLHKKLDSSDKKNHQIVTKKKKMEFLFKEEHLVYLDKTPFSYFENEVIYHAVLNKRAIEKAYQDGYIKMHDYFDVLDYQEKQRLMNYEIHECLKELPSFQIESQSVYIPFFDLKMNRIYENEMVLFVLKQYRRIMHDYQDLFDKKRYGSHVYNSPFSSLKPVLMEGEQSCFYSLDTKKLYFLNSFDFEEYITFPCEEEVALKQMAKAYFEKNAADIINIMETQGCITEKFAKKLRKKNK